MKKRFMLLFFFIMVVIVLAYMFPKEPEIGTFCLSDYQYYAENFSSDEKLDNASDIKELMEEVDMLWKKLYGESVKYKKPYRVFYDSQNDIWLIQASLKSNLMGGVSNILVQRSTGNVLAIWHTK